MRTTGQRAGFACSARRLLDLLWIAGLVSALWVFGLRSEQTVHFADGQEYLTMTMSFVRHRSPEFRTGDDTALLESLPKHWRRSEKSRFHPGQGPPKAYFEARDRRYYGYHFFTYPALVAPLRAGLDGGRFAARAHQYTNLIWLTLALLSFWQLRLQPRLFYGLSAFASLTPVLWFSRYAHTESFVYACGVIALCCYLRERLLLAVFFNSLAATQYQPLALLSLGIAAHWLLRERHALLERRPRALAQLGALALACALVAIPGLFFYAKFGTPNLIARENMARVEFMSAGKFFGLFVDPNIGMLGWLPGLLLLLLMTAGWALARALRTRDGSGLALLFLALVTMLSSTVQRNWNHPTFGPSRYVVYSIAPLLLFIGHELRSYSGKRGLLEAYLGVCLALQLFIHVEYGFFAYRGPDAAHHSALAKLVLERWPALYSPPDEVFCERTASQCRSDDGLHLAGEDLPIVWRDAKGTAHKILAPRCDASRILQAQPWSPDEIARIQHALQGCHGDHGTFYIAL